MLENILESIKACDTIMIFKLIPFIMRIVQTSLVKGTLKYPTDVFIDDDKNKLRKKCHNTLDLLQQKMLDNPIETDRIIHWDFKEFLYASHLFIDENYIYPEVWT